MTAFELSHSGLFQNARNTLYPFRRTVNSLKDLASIVRYDHCAALFRANHRTKNYYILSNVAIVDVDNKGLPAEQWMTPESAYKAFNDPEMFVVYSRNHNKDKLHTNGSLESPRPRFHLYFPLDKPCKDGELYKRTLKEACSAFPAVDKGATNDCAHFFYGVENPVCEYWAGGEKVESI